ASSNVGVRKKRITSSVAVTPSSRRSAKRRPEIERPESGERDERVDGGEAGGGGRGRDGGDGGERCEERVFPSFEEGLPRRFNEVTLPYENRRGGGARICNRRLNLPWPRRFRFGSVVLFDRSSRPSSQEGKMLSSLTYFLLGPMWLTQLY